MATNQLVQHVVNSIESVVGSAKTPIALHEPSFIGNEWNYVKECIDTGWVSSVGKYVDLFEKKIAEATETKFGVAVANGTVALQVCCRLVGVEANDEVLVPALTFVATANAVMYVGAVPHFVDSSEETLGVCPEKLKKYLSEISEIKNGECRNKKSGRRIKALIVMHTYGHPVDLDAMLEVCQEFNIELIEDAAESLGSYYKNKHTGSHGKVSALSFNGNKIVTTGGGGAIVTNDETLAKKAKYWTTTAKRPHPWDFYHDELGYNFRLPNINAALGVAQLENLKNFVNDKRNLAQRYKVSFLEVQGLEFFQEASYAKSNFWLNAILLDKPDIELRNQILQACHDKKILVRPTWILLNKLPMYQKHQCADLSVANNIEARLINLPSSSFLGANS